MTDSNGLTDMLGGLLGSQGGEMESMASLIQGFDSNDASIEDIAGMLGGGSKSSGGIGGMLNDFLK